MADTAQNTITPLEGKTTIDNQMFFEPERLSYQSADHVAARIAREVRDKVKGRTVVIAGTQLLADFANLQAIYLLLDSIRSDYGALISQGIDIGNMHSLVAPEKIVEFKNEATFAEAAISSPLAPITTVLDATLGLVSLFREDVEYHGAKTVVDTLAFEIALAAWLKAEGATKVFVPDLMMVPLTEVRPGSLRDRLKSAQNAKASVWKLVGPLISDLARLEGELDEAVREKDQQRLDALASRVSELRSVMQPIADPLARTDQRLADLQNKWEQVDASSGLSLLARLLRAETILPPIEGKKGEEPLYLHAKVVSSGGHHRISRNLFRMLFLGDGLSFAGGATIRWALLGKDGSIEKGGIFVARRKSRSQPLSDDDGQDS